MKIRIPVHLAVAQTAAILVAGLASAPSAAVRGPGITALACPQQSWDAADAGFAPLPGARVYSGAYEGGFYRIEIPDAWNGELMLSAHGFVSNAGPQGSRLRVGNPAIREHLIAGGFAWAASSYRCNGYVPGVGLQDTMALTDLFTKFNGGTAPRRTYLTGTSMGGHVTLLGMHEFPTAFSGGLAMCPAGPELFDYFTAVGAAAEVITGIQFASPGSGQQDLAKMRPLLGEPSALTAKGRQLASVEIGISGGPRPFAVEGLAAGGRFFGNISGAALAGGTTPANRAVGTTHIKYAIDPDLGLSASQLDARARRKEPDMAFRGAESPYDELVPFDGRIERPLLTMHGTGDLFVPIMLEQTLKRAIVAAGQQDRLVQRIYRVPGHCGFSVPEQIRAFDDLVTWVRDGVKPAGDEVFGDLRDAGRMFTHPLRPGDPGGIRIEP